MFVLLAKQRILDVKREDQQHARKFHCYYWVFKKEQCKIDYKL
jgi:hypothetical protein